MGSTLPAAATVPTRAIALLSIAVFAAVALRSLLAPLVLAGLAAVLAQPLHQRLERSLGRRSNRAALLSLVGLLLGAATPLFGLALLVVVQLRRLAADVLGMPPGHSLGSRLAQLIEQGIVALGAISERYLGGRFDVEGMARERLVELGGQLSHGVSGFAAITGRLFVAALVLLVTLFFLLRDGGSMIDRLLALLPLPESSGRRFVVRLQRTVEGVFLGALATSLFQGSVGALGFLVTGFENFAIWGTMIALASFVPVFGTALIWGPAVAQLLFNRHLGAAVTLLLIGLLISSSDNLLRLVVLRQRASLPPLLLFLSIFGGLVTCGPMGAVYGPLLAAVAHEATRLHLDQSTPRPATEAT